MALGSTQPLEKMSTRKVPGDIGSWCLRLTTSPPSRAECHEIWEPNPSGNLWATPSLLGTPLPLPSFPNLTMRRYSLIEIERGNESREPNAGQVPMTCSLSVCWEFWWNLQGRVSQEQLEAPPRDVGTDLTTFIIVGRFIVIEFYQSEEQRPALRWFLDVLGLLTCKWQSYCKLEKYSPRKVASRNWFWRIYRITSFSEKESVVWFTTNRRA
jgi:hypothetical protein